MKEHSPDTVRPRLGDVSNFKTGMETNTFSGVHLVLGRLSGTGWVGVCCWCFPEFSSLGEGLPGLCFLLSRTVGLGVEGGALILSQGELGICYTRYSIWGELVIPRQAW